MAQHMIKVIFMEFDLLQPLVAILKSNHHDHQKTAIILLFLPLGLKFSSPHFSANFEVDADLRARFEYAWL